MEAIKCCALVNTGTEAFCVSSIIISLINQKKQTEKPIRTEPQRIETLVSSSMKNIPVYPVEIKGYR